MFDHEENSITLDTRIANDLKSKMANPQRSSLVWKKKTTFVFKMFIAVCYIVRRYINSIQVLGAGGRKLIDVILNIDTELLWVSSLELLRGMSINHSVACKINPAATMFLMIQ